MGKGNSEWRYRDEAERPPREMTSWAERSSCRQSWVFPVPLSATISVIALQEMPPWRRRSSSGQPRVSFGVWVERGWRRRSSGFILVALFGR